MKPISCHQEWGLGEALCAQEPQRVLLSFLALSHHGNQICTTVPGICPGSRELPTTESGSRSQGWAGSQPLLLEQRLEVTASILNPACLPAP